MTNILSMTEYTEGRLSEADIEFEFDGKLHYMEVEFEYLPEYLCGTGGEVNILSCVEYDEEGDGAEVNLADMPEGWAVELNHQISSSLY